MSDYLNQVIYEFSGKQTTGAEQKRLEATMPKWGDSPTVAKAKLDQLFIVVEDIINSRQANLAGYQTPNYDGVIGAAHGEAVPMPPPMASSVPEAPAAVEQTQLERDLANPQVEAIISALKRGDISRAEARTRLAALQI